MPCVIVCVKDQFFISVFTQSIYYFIISFSTLNYVAPDPSEVIDISADEDDFEPVTIKSSPEHNRYVLGIA